LLQRQKLLRKKKQQPLLRQPPKPSLQFIWIKTIKIITSYRAVGWVITATLN